MTINWTRRSKQDEQFTATMRLRGAIVNYVLAYGFDTAIKTLRYWSNTALVHPAPEATIIHEMWMDRKRREAS